MLSSTEHYTEVGQQFAWANSYGSQEQLFNRHPAELNADEPGLG